MKRERSSRGYYDDPEGDTAYLNRYLVYFHSRLPLKAPKWMWHYWVPPTGQVLPFYTPGIRYNFWDAGIYGLWLNGEDYPTMEWFRYRKYYGMRMPWRRWNLSSAERHAARNGYRVVEK